MGDFIRIDVDGVPAPQGNHRVNRGGRIYETSKAVGPWREAIRAETQRQRAGMTISNAVFIFIGIRLPRPAGHYGTGRNKDRLRPSAPRWPAVKPDIDKLERAILDGIVAGGALADDALVVAKRSFKEYAGAGQVPGCVIQITEAEK
jgi:crossover junction endodeoxyribonuclease RusA